MAWWNPFETNAETDVDRGLSYMRQYHNICTLNYAANYRLSFDQLQDRYSSGFARFLGQTMNTSDISDSEISWAAEYLAAKTKGTPPKDQVDWLQALSKANESIFSHALDSFKETASEGIEVVGSGAKTVYQGAIGGVKEVVGDAADIATTPFKSLAVPLLIAAVVLGGLVFVAGKSGAVRIDRAA